MAKTRKGNKIVAVKSHTRRRAGSRRKTRVRRHRRSTPN